jgi:hypothetical protein
MIAGIPLEYFLIVSTIMFLWESMDSLPEKTLLPF